MSSMTFEQLELDSVLVRALADMGYAKPTTIQSQVIPEAMSGRDIMASAPTGTGKTAAFLLPICQHLLDFPRRNAGPTRVLILTPTRELAIQIGEDAKKIVKHTNLRVEVITGGVHESQHLPALTKTTDIVVATPGRLLQYIDRESFDSRDIEMLILDEADRMLDMGFIKDVDRIAAEARWRRQTMLFSATLEGRGLMSFAADLLKDPVQLAAEPPRSERKKINQWVHLADNPEHKFALLVHLLRQPDVTRSIVFVKTRDRLMELASRLQQEGLHNAWLRGEMDQDKRIEALARFRIGRVNILVATDVASRGIDLPEVSHVINYDMPRTADVYVHRIGRTGRAGQKGTAISLVEAHDMPLLVKVEKYTEEALKRRIIEELRPKHKEAKVNSRKRKDTKGKKLDEPVKKEKVRLRDTKAKGKPKWAGPKPGEAVIPKPKKKAAPVIDWDDEDDDE
ncbi:ATP-dependent RNA helicase SrmB [Oceanisphaera sp. IT1-181]|uniref:ATP-dependent RNA helicase SrmB n=1 Tax=Oceanisphaera sp. IT1-181 TaxID=3081199 RepID=UPI0029CA7AB1|nr:ATP-dependent RNA helicase SrmB [Oceanisphaera sp. IT1-181]